MKYALKFRCDTPVCLPVNYNKIVQAAILKWLGDEEASAFLHDEGYQMDKRKYKLYTFSDIRGTYTFDKTSRKIRFEDEFYLILSFYTDDYAQIIKNHARTHKSMLFGNTYARLEECMLAEEVYDDCIVDTASPITVHSTFDKPDGSKKTYYYEPTEKEFSEMIRLNLIRKYKSYHMQEPEDCDFEIRPYNKQKLRRIDTHYSGFMIRAWRGSYVLSGSKELIKMALLSGLGDRNGAGFGCVLQRKQ